MSAVAWKYIPTKIGVLDRKTGKFHVDAPVTSTRLLPPVSSAAHPGTAIRGDRYLAEIHTPYGVRTYGFADGCIDASLRMAVKLGPGQERDEVVAKWKNAPSNACGRRLAGSSRKRKRR